MAYVRVCGFNDNSGKTSVKYFRKLTWEMKLQAQPLFQDGTHKFIMLFPRGKAKVEDSINYKMLRKGLGKIDEEFKIPEHVRKVLMDGQEHASKKLYGIWKVGGDFGDGYDEY